MGRFYLHNSEGTIGAFYYDDILEWGEFCDWINENKIVIKGDETIKSIPIRPFVWFGFKNDNDFMAFKLRWL